MLTLERKGYEITCNGKKLTVVKQETKGPNKEVVKIEGLEGSNGKKWLSLTLIPDNATTTITDDKLVPREVTTIKKYELTPEEAKEVAELQAKIDAIINAAKARYVPTSKKDITKMSIAELEAYIAAKKASIKE